MNDRSSPRPTSWLSRAANRYVLAGLALAALALIALARGAGWVSSANPAVDDTLSPVQDVVAAPVRTAQGIGGWFAALPKLKSENARLRAENARLRQYYELVHSMRDKMERYEELLSLNADPQAHFITARVVRETEGPFVRARLINAGASSCQRHPETGRFLLDPVTGERFCVEEGHAVMDDRGLIGHVVTAGKRSSRVLLVTDLNSRVPVMADRTNARAILAGDNSDLPRLTFQRRNQPFEEGDRIVTSGDAGALPRGLPVGVAYRGRGDVWRVRLYADLNAADYVRVVSYHFPPAPEDEPEDDPAVQFQDGETGLEDTAVTAADPLSDDAEEASL